jgi:glycosyltransferase involved in cell wall biosynthesis
VVFSIHGQLNTDILRKNILKFLLENVDLVFCTGYFSYNFVLSIFSKRVILQPSGISDLFLKFPSVVKKSSDFQIVTVSNLLRVKNLYFLLEIARYLPNIKFIIIGDGNERNGLNDYIQKLAIDNVQLLGFRPQEDVKFYCLTSDVFLLTSYAEGTPTSVLEAMSAGLPVVSSNAGGIKYLIKDFSNGFIIDDFSVREYVDRIMLLKNDTSLRNVIRIKNAELSKNFRWEVVAKTISNNILECYNG